MLQASYLTIFDFSIHTCSDRQIATLIVSSATIPSLSMPRTIAMFSCLNQTCNCNIHCNLHNGSK